MAPRDFPTPLLGILVLASLAIAALAVPVVGAKDQPDKHEEKGDHQDSGKSHGGGKTKGAAAEQPPPPPVVTESGSSVQATPGPAESPVIYRAL